VKEVVEAFTSPVGPDGTCATDAARDIFLPFKGRIEVGMGFC